MKIIILGGGSIGGSVATELSTEDNDIVVIDNNEANLEPLKSKEGIKTVLGNATSPDTLSKSNLDENSLLLCLTDSEEINLLASIVAHAKFDVKKIICRLKGSEYKKIAKQIASHVDFFINPEDLITDEIKSLLKHPGALEILDFAEEKIKLVSVYAKKSGILVGRQIKELNNDCLFEFLRSLGLGSTCFKNSNGTISVFLNFIGLIEVRPTFWRTFK